MITPNTDFTFIQVKSDDLRTLTWQNGTVAEVVEMTTQLPNAKESNGSSSTKREGKICKRVGRLDDLLLSAVDETLKQVFREEGVKVIYDYLENKCHLRREQIFEKPQVFSADLERLLASASLVIEKMVLKNLFSKLELEFEERQGYEFLDYIRELREKCGC